MRHVYAQCCVLPANPHGGCSFAAQVRNERALEALRDEMEELEEQLTDSITASIQGKKVGASG